MFGRKARRRHAKDLRSRAAWLIEQHGVSGALVVATERFYQAGEDREAQDRACELRSAIKQAAGLGSLDTATRYLVLNEQERSGS